MDIQVVRRWFRANKNTLYAGIAALGSDVAAQDALLENRTGQPFDQEWIAAHQRNEAYKSGLSAHERSAVESCAASIARDAFLFAMRASGSSKLAADVGDDFHLMAEALIADVADDFALSLLASYWQGRVPDNRMTRTRENLLLADYTRLQKSQTAIDG